MSVKNLKKKNLIVILNNKYKNEFAIGKS